MKSYSWVVGVVLILVVGVWVSLIIIAPSQNQPPVQPQNQAQVEKKEEKQEPVWQLHVVPSAYAAWRFNSQTGDAELLVVRDVVNKEKYTIKFPASK